MASSCGLLPRLFKLKPQCQVGGLVLMDRLFLLKFSYCLFNLLQNNINLSIVYENFQHHLSSTMAISLLNSISDFLESGVDECTTNLFDWTTNDMSGTDEGEGESDEEHDTSVRRSKSTNSLR